jgi:hypothetical protein
VQKVAARISGAILRRAQFRRRGISFLPPNSKHCESFQGKCIAMKMTYDQFFGNNVHNPSVNGANGMSDIEGKVASATTHFSGRKIDFSGA